jgi:outer membrane protein assembly factor BamB
MSNNLTSNKLKILGSKTFLTVILILMLSLSAVPFLNQKNATVNAQTVSTVPTDLLQYEWLGAQASPNLNHFSQGPAPSSADVLWQKVLPTNTGANPVAFNGMLFITQGSNVTALDPQTGAVIYSVAVPSPVTGRSSSASYVTKIDSTHMTVLTTVASSITANTTLLAAWSMHGLNIADGSIMWNSPANYGPATNRFSYVPETKTFYGQIGNSTGRGGTQNTGALQAWYLPDPTQPPTLKWTYIGDGPVYGGGCFLYGDGRIYIGGAEPHQICIDANTGQILWTTLLTGAPNYAASYYNGVLYQGCLDNTFIALNGTTGKIIWTYNPHDFGFWCSATAAGYGLVYELNVDGYLYALNATNGQVVWKHMGPGQSYPGYVEIADGKVYACTGQATVSPLIGMGSSEYSCLNATTGEVIWQTNKEFFSGPNDYTCIAYGNFYGIDQELSTGVTVDSNVGGIWPAAQQHLLICYGNKPKDWSMFGGNPAHTAVGYGAPLNMTLKWVYHTDGPVMSSPAVVQGKVYIGSWDKNIYCLNSNTGTKIWNFTTGYFVRSSPAVVNGKVYTGADDGNIYCLDANTGSLLWKVLAPGQVVQIMLGTYPQFDSSPVVVNGQVYVGALDGKLYCLDANSGNIVWTIQTTGSILSTPTYVAGDGIYFASVDGFVYKVNPSGGIIWNVSTPIGLEIAMEGSVCVGNGLAVIGSGGAKNTPAGIGQMYALNASTGAMVWKYTELTQSGNLQPTWTATYQNGALGPVFYFNDFYDLDCVNATNGKLIWQSYLTRESFSLPAYSDGKLYTGRMTFGIYVSNATDGKKLEYFDAGAEVASSIAIYESNLYFGCYNFNVYCVEQSSAGTTYYGNPEPISPSPSPSPTPTPTPSPEVTPNPTPTFAPTPTPASTPTAIATPTMSPSPSATPDSQQGLTTETYAIIAAAIVIIVVIIAVAVILRKRK